MESILSKTNTFIDEIKKTDVYLRYKDLELQLKDKPELMNQVNRFRMQSFDIQISHRYGHYNSYEQIIALKKQNEELVSNPLVKSFLDAELDLTKMLATIYNRMAESIDIDMSFLD